MKVHRSAIREALRRPSPQPTARRQRGALFDLALALIVCAIALSNTPTGALIRYGAAYARSGPTELPSLTAWFEHGATRPPPAEVEVHWPEAEPVPPGGVPEPFRSAIRVTLAQPGGIKGPGTPEAQAEALLAIDALHRSVEAATPHARVETALLLWVLPDGQYDRALNRAKLAGASDPTRYSTLRRFIPVGQALRADRLVAGTLALGALLDFQWPVSEPWPVSSHFGDRVHPVLGTRKFHNGLDIAAPVGTPVHAVQGGRVTQVGENAASGRFVVIEHGHGIRTSYCHLSATHVSRGQSISRGTRIADTGNTGRSTGPHLHWTLKVAGRWTDPLRFTAPSPPRGEGA